MSFDMEPDRDPHDDCAVEIRRLTQLLDSMTRERDFFGSQCEDKKAEVELWKRKAQDALLQVRDWEEAVNFFCTCGGRGPQDMCCPACAVYHRAKRTEKRSCDHDPMHTERGPICEKCGQTLKG